MQMWQKTVKIARFPFLALIRLYQKTLSLDHGPLSALFPHGFCRFYPTCSEYGYQAINKRGIFKGTLLALWRIARCNPFNEGGVDHVPKCKK
ncbi:membrane protein insertion efficiency factor YidD [Patescibacteria group bacterium]|nr:membrane protein insertion efficiency factor YidD [Patescibacteria group bacterium]